MSRDGSGNYTLPSGNPVITNTIISSSTQNSTMSDVAAALTQSLSRDGQTTPTADLTMGNFKLRNLAAGIALTDAATVGQTQSGALMLLGSVGGTDTITASTSPAITAYASGQTFRFVAAGTNTTGIPTLNINGLGAKNITRNGAAGIVPGDIRSGSVVTVTYDGTEFQILGIIGASGVIGYGRNVNSVLVNQGPTIPLTADEIILQDALGGVPYKFKNVSLANNISTVGVINGFDTGTAPANGFAAVYWMYNPTTGVLGTLSTNATSVKAPEIYSGGAAPSGFTVSALAAVLPLGTVNFTYAPFALTDRKVDFLIATILSGSSFIGVATARTSTAIPLNARYVGGANNVGSTATSVIQQNLGPASTAALGLQVNITTVQAGTTLGIPFRCAISTPQTIYQTTVNSAGTPSFSISINSYEF